jgi:hypothetical protein
MIDFLKLCGITDVVIQEIKNVNSSANVYNLSCNQDEVIKIITYLQSLNVKCIDKLLIYKIDKFFVSFDKFYNLFEKSNINSFIELLNNDFELIDNL